MVSDFQNINLPNTYLAYSIKLSVTEGAPSFFTIRIFRGGAGHCSETRSLPGVPYPCISLIQEGTNVGY